MALKLKHVLAQSRKARKNSNILPFSLTIPTVIFSIFISISESHSETGMINDFKSSHTPQTREIRNVYIAHIYIYIYIRVYVCVIIYNIQVCVCDCKLNYSCCLRYRLFAQSKTNEIS